MNVAFFLDRVEEILPPSKAPTPTQFAEYRRKLDRFTPAQLDQLYEAIIDNCKFWPKIADINEQAKGIGILAAPRQDEPHIWTPTDCTKCGGSGLVAAFWSQEFELGEAGKTQILRLHYLIPYYSSAEYNNRQDHDDIRSVYRCDCSAGEIKTLPMGVKRLGDIPQVIRKAWAA